MSIMWSYLDKENAVVKVLQDYDSMEFNLRNADEQIQAIRDNMENIGKPKMDGMPKAHNPQAGEDHLVADLDRIDTLKEKHRQAEEYMAWFLPAWRQLNDEERYVLESFFMTGGRDPARRVGEHFGIEKNSVYKKRKRALCHLTLLLYGKE